MHGGSMAQLKTSSKVLIGIVIVVFLLWIGTPNLLRSRYAASHADFTVSEDALDFGQSDKAAGGGGGFSTHLYTKVSAAEPQIPERKIVRTAAFDLIVDDVSAAKAAISRLAESTDGFVENSESSKSHEGLQRAKLTVRVPQSHLDEVRDQIRKLASRVELDKSEARD